MSSALEQCRSIRTPNVLRPRSVNHASNGLGTAPAELRRKNSRSRNSSELVITAPPTTSEWPPRYLVVECTTTSAPSSSGVCRYGVANVLRSEEHTSELQS